ncbi:ATP-dependent helicase [Leptolyngbya sp. FACHB-261]|nr:ATP-dependent helicase [Leptolyngbya sp. FACHB-261]
MTTEPFFSAPLEPKLQAIRNRLRPGQQVIADWQAGPLAVSAVPGAGKSTGMAGAAALVIARHQLNRRRQLVVVTFTRSAVASIRAKIRSHLRELGLPQGSFLVNTLHGLALNIAGSQPELSGVRADLKAVLQPSQKARFLRQAVDQWIAENPQPFQLLIEGRAFDGEETERQRRQFILRSEILPALAQEVVQEARSSGLSPNQVREISRQVSEEVEFSVLGVAAGLYERYERILRAANAIDYDDMILGALRVLEDPVARQIWQERVFAVFEDEAQDSSPLQTRLLEILSQSETDGSNLVRVGDPNQAINSTFTPADPRFFNDFCDQCGSSERLAILDQAGRSSRIIIDAANFVLNWVNQSSLVGRERAFRPQQIQSVDAGDPQADANPAPEGRGLELLAPRDIYHSAQLLGARALELLKANPDRTAAVLVRQHNQSRFLCEQLQFLQKDHGIVVYDTEQRERRSRVPAQMLALLQFINRPHSPDNLKNALSVLLERQLIPSQDLNALAVDPERFLYPGPLDPALSATQAQIRRKCAGLLRARLELPLFNLIPFVALALGYDASELATADKLTERIVQQVYSQGAHPSLNAVLGVLNDIVLSENFEAVEVEDPEVRYIRPGQLTVITMHKAKGLDWDYVFIPFLHERLIPGQPYVPASAQFLGDFTLPEVARAQIRAYVHGDEVPSVGEAWRRAGELKAAEEFRLLYVAMTRAKRLLWMSAEKSTPFSWNNLEMMQDTAKACPILKPLAQRFPSSLVPC